MAALSQLLARRGGRGERERETQSQLEEKEEELNRNTTGESCCFFRLPTSTSMPHLNHEVLQNIADAKLRDSHNSMANHGALGRVGLSCSARQEWERRSLAEGISQKAAESASNRTAPLSSLSFRVMARKMTLLSRRSRGLNRRRRRRRRRPFTLWSGSD